jgi:TusA-related sulfurtransferase
MDRGQMTDNIAPGETLVCRGSGGPNPILQTIKTPAKMTSSQIREVQGSDSGPKNDLPDVVAGNGHTYLGYKTEKGGLAVLQESLIEATQNYESQAPNSNEIPKSK